MEIIVTAAFTGFALTAFALGIVNLILHKGLLLIQKEHLKLHKDEEAVVSALTAQVHSHGEF